MPGGFSHRNFRAAQIGKGASLIRPALLPVIRGDQDQDQEREQEYLQMRARKIMDGFHGASPQPRRRNEAFRLQRRAERFMGYEQVRAKQGASHERSKPTVAKSRRTCIQIWQTKSRCTCITVWQV